MTAVSLSLFSTVQAVEYRGIGGQPANPRSDNERSKSIFVYELKPGDILRDAIRISNGTSTKERIAVYATDSLQSSGGAFACEQQADKANDVGSWIKLDESVIELAPQSSKDINFTLTVPKDATVGESNGCIAIQALGQRPVKDFNGIALNFRSAVRVAVTVPGDISKVLNITVLKRIEVKDENKFGVQIVLKNAGNVSLDTDVTLKFKDIFGRNLQTIQGTYAVLAGLPTELNFEFNRALSPGIYRIEATAAYNSDTTKTLGKSTDRGMTVSRTMTFFAWPKPQITIAIIIGILVLASILYRLYYRRFLLKRRRANARRHTVGPSETLERIAERFDVSWYDIALLNSLKPPYKIKNGEKLYIPPKAQRKANPQKRSKAKK